MLSQNSNHPLGSAKNCQLLYLHFKVVKSDEHVLFSEFQTDMLLTGRFHILLKLKLNKEGIRLCMDYGQTKKTTKKHTQHFEIKTIDDFMH